MPLPDAADIRSRISEQPWLRSGVVLVGAVAFGVGARAVTYPFMQARVPFLFFFPSIIGATLYGGTLAGIATAVICPLLAAILIEQHPIFLQHDATDRLASLFYVLTSALIILLGSTVHRAQRRADNHRMAAEEAHREAIVAIRESDRRFRTMADSAPVLIWIADTSRSCVWVNKSWLAFTGRTLEQEQGIGWSHGIHPDDRDHCVNVYNSAFEQRTAFTLDYRRMRHDGEYRWLVVNGVPNFSADGAFTGYIGSCMDITDRKVSESRVVESEERFRALANSSPAMMWVNGLNGREFVNRAYAEFVGLRPEEIIGAEWRKFVHPDDLANYVDAYNRAFAARGPFYAEVRTRRHDGVYRWLRSEGMPRFSESGEFLGYVGLGLDITEMKSLLDERNQLLTAERAAREEAERNSQLKDEFLATVSHELRTPLNAMLGWAQIIRRSTADTPTVEEGLEVIERNARMQAQLIEDLLDMSRIISGKVRLETQRVDLGPVIEAAIATVLPAAQAKGVRLRKVLDGDAGPITGDASRLQQVIWNLLINAVKFTPRGGRVEVLLERVNSHVELLVTDTGEGIAPEFLPHVFDRFRQADGSTTRRHGGLGLGLAIVRHLVEMHGGTVRAISAGLGQGASFSVMLPLRIADTDNGDRLHPTSEHVMLPKYDRPDPKLDGLCVLVVDDEPDARTLARRLLEDCGSGVVEAGNVDEALVAVDRERPDVIVSDIGMPGRDGIDFITTLRKVGNTTPAVALTAFARAEDRLKTIHAGYQMHLAKPVEPAELVAVVASLVGRIGSGAKA